MTPPRSESCPVFAVVGKDRFLRAEAIEVIVRRFDGGAVPVGPRRVDGATTEAADVLDELRTESLFGDRRLVIVDDADGFISANRSVMEQYCSSPSHSGCLVLACNSLPKNTRIYKFIIASGQVVQCEAPRGQALLGWMIDRARTCHDKRMSRPAAVSLQQHVGDAPGVLAGEVAKLSAYVGGRGTITPDDVDALVGHSREEKVFAVIDAVSAGDTATALKQWDQVLATDRAAPGRAIGGLAWRIRRLLDARREWDVDLARGTRDSIYHSR